MSKPKNDNLYILVQVFYFWIVKKQFFSIYLICFNRHFVQIVKLIGVNGSVFPAVLI